jgi:hypothetical protein
MCTTRNVPHKRVRFAVHINDLPFEILGELLSHLANEHPLHLRHSLFTCRRWYQAAVYHPTIWTTVAIDELYFDFFMDRPIEAGCSLVRACLERSGKHPLRLFRSLSRNPLRISPPQTPPTQPCSTHPPHPHTYARLSASLERTMESISAPELSRMDLRA